MALHLVIATAEALADSGALEEQAWMAALPGHEDDVDFDVARDVLFRDHDVLELFEPSLDGVEDPSSAEARLRGFAHLHPRDWFVRFADC